MIVEDEALTAMGIQSCLEEMGYTVTSTLATGEEAIKKVKEDKPDLVLMDIILAGKMDGIETAAEIRSRFNTPVIYLTAYSDEEMLKRLMKSEPFGYITKPFNERELRVTVEIAFYKHGMEEALRESQLRYRTLFEGANDAIYLIDPRSQRILDCNPKAAKITGYNVTQLKNMKMAQLHPEEEQDIVSKIFTKTAKLGVLSGISGINQLTKEGKLVPVEINTAEIKMSNKRYDMAIVRDITDRKRAEDTLMQERNRLIGILDSMQDGVYISNKDYDIEYINPILKKEYGPVKGRKCYEYFHGRKDGCPACNNKDVFAGKTIHWEWFSPKNERTYDVIDTPFENPDGTVSKLEILRDITARKRMEERLKSAAVTDDLTGLLNRRGFYTLTEQQCRLADRTGRLMSLLYIDLDGMKMINDQLGHQAGDQALIDVAEILKKTFRRADIIARMGGDEFAVLLAELATPDVESIIVDHVKNNLKMHNKHSGRSYNLSFSMGITHYDPGKPCSISSLLTRADALMYEDKKHNKEQDVLPSLKERRIYKRFIPGGSLRAELDGPNGISIKDISIGGIGLRTPQPLTANSVHRIRLYVGEHEEITSKGIVVRSSLKGKESGKGKTPPYYESGLMFTEMKKSMKISLEKLIASLAG